jgi:energy-coupling factor transporter transmembrane protein EcfT
LINSISSNIGIILVVRQFYTILILLNFQLLIFTKQNKKGKDMKKIFPIILVSMVILFAFTLSNDGKKDLSQKNTSFSNETVVIHGPALDGPLSTLNESFEGASFPPAGWTKLSPDGGTGWTSITNGTTPLPGWNGGVATVPTGGGTKTSYATWNTGGATANDQWLITPQ